MELDLNDRVVLVAGSSRGIGRAIAEAFLSEGARVAVTGRSADSLEQSEADLKQKFGKNRVLALRADMTAPEDINRAMKNVTQAWGDADVVVANVGTGRGTAGWTADDAEWLRLIDTNLLGATRVAAAAVPSMLKASSGSIIFISSIAGLESLSAPLAYGAAKAGLVNYAKNLARQLGPSGIRVNVVAPGNVLFEGGSWDQRRAQRPEEVDRYIEAEVPLRRFGRAEEIASVVTFLASERASFVTGACVVVDGGQTRGV